MKRIRVTRDAKRDLDEIWLYIARDNVDAANRLADELTTDLRRLVHPRRWVARATS